MTEGIIQKIWNKYYLDPDILKELITEIKKELKGLEKHNYKYVIDKLIGDNQA